MKAACAMMDNYKCPYGSSANVYQLMWQLPNNVLTHYGDDYKTTFGQAYKCIVRHLEAKRPIIVGVHHTFYYGDKSYNEGTTDHWIIVTGKGYDGAKQQYYFTYMETGTNYVDVGCDNNENRLYYDREKIVLCDPKNYKGKTYVVSQVRPNDGLYLNETIEQPGNPYK